VTSVRSRLLIICLLILAATPISVRAVVAQLGEDPLSSWLDQFALEYGYTGVFFASLLGASTVVVPVPYTLIIYALGSVLDPILLALSAGLGSALGEFGGYVLGYFGRRVIDEKRRRRVTAMLRLFNRYGPIVIFIFALTPLPDDLLFIPLGIMRFSPVRAFVPSLIGKILMCLILAYAGKTSFKLVLAAYGENSILGMVVTTVGLAAVIYWMMKTDWEKLAEKYAPHIMKMVEGADTTAT